MERGSKNIKETNSEKSITGSTTSSNIMPTDEPSSVNVLTIKKNNLHSCQICCKNFASPEQLSRHCVTHSGTLLYKCTWCSKILTQHSHLKDHRLKCRQGNRGSHDIHSEKINAGDIQEKCIENNCTRLNANARKQQELKYASAGKPGSIDNIELPVLETILKEEEFETEITTKEIQMSDYGGSLTSELEDKTFVQNQIMGSPVLFHSQEGKAYVVKMPYKPQDVTTLSDRKVLPSNDASSVVHNSLPPDNYWCEPITMFECDKCTVSFETEYNLNKHFCPAEIIDPCPRNFCNICFKFFAHPSKMKRHYVTHTGQRPYKCGICGKTFTQSGHARKHQITHSRLKLRSMTF